MLPQSRHTPDEEANVAKRIDDADVSPVIARKIAARASGADEAIVVGNRAGMIEWANAAWTKVTGYAVDDAIAKPIGWLLDTADIDPTVVDFVQRHFLSGRRCEVEFPVTTPDGRALWIHLDVEPFKDALGEISDFVAVATDITTRRVGEIALENRIAQALADSEGDGVEREVEAGTAARADADIAWLTPRLALTRIEQRIDESRRQLPRGERDPLLDELTRTIREALASSAREAGEREAVDIGRRTTWLCAERVRVIPTTLRLDLELATHLPDARVDIRAFEILVGELLDVAIESVGSEWGTISLTTGVAEPGLALASPVDPTVDRFPLSTERPHLFLELHDTAISMSREALRFVATRSGESSRDVRALAYALASARAERLGGALRVHSVPGIGTRVLLYLPMR